MASESIFNSDSDEETWIIQINELVSETDLNILSKIPVCIYQVPKSLSSAKPEAFSPQLIAIGPYNHLRPHLYPMQRLKLFSAKKVLSHFNKLDLKQLAEQLSSSAPYLRACFHKYLDIKDDTLLYIMAIDGLFLLDLLHNYLKERGSHSFFTGLEQQVQTSGVKLTKDAVIRDVVMLENQIPTYVLKKIVMTESSKPVDLVEEELGSMLLSFCKEHSPFVLQQSTFSCSEAVERPHLLDLLYSLIVSQQENSEPPSIKQGNTNYTEPAAAVSSRTSQLANTIIFLKKLKGPLKSTLGFLKKLKEMKLPISGPIKKLTDAILQVNNLQLGSASPPETEVPVMMMIPSVSELYSAGIRFQPAKGGITTIEFDERRGVFYLPVLKLDVNSEVIMRNLVAYEALTKSEFLIFTRYTELMRAIIDTKNDVQLLVKEEIIKSNLSEKEAEELFNGMSKSIGPTHTPKLDETIKKVNKYFNDFEKVNGYRVIANYVYSSWKLFTLLATLVLLGMTALQTFCSVYDCPRHLLNIGDSS